MAIDHFDKHKSQIGRTDWNFNFLFDDQPQVAELAGKYAPLLNHPGLHKPIPGQWLHATLLRVGFLEDFTEAEMLAVADKFARKLANIELPPLIVGERCRLWNGGPFLSITPEQPLREIFSHSLGSLLAVVGRDRLPALTVPPGLLNTLTAAIGRDRLPGRLQFVPHITLAYPKTYNDERGLRKQLESHPIAGTEVRINNVSLIKQRVVDDYYAWDVIKSLSIGQAGS
jgi:hypothetical protein